MAQWISLGARWFVTVALVLYAAHQVLYVGRPEVITAEKAAGYVLWLALLVVVVWLI